ncbi:MAG: flagellar motor switch protein FliN [Leptonema sp. (in: bacteria)]
MADDKLEESKLTSEDLDKILSGLEEGETPKKESKEPSLEENLSDLLQNIGEPKGSLTEEFSSSIAEDIINQSTVSLSSSQIERSSIQVNELYDITVKLAVELGRTLMSIKDIILISEGSIIELDKHIDDEVDILINDRLFGRGKLVLLDEFYGVQITQILNPSTFKNL